MTGKIHDIIFFKKHTTRRNTILHNEILILDFRFGWNRSLSRRDAVLTVTIFNILWIFVSNCRSDNDSSNASNLFISSAPNINIVSWLTHLITKTTKAISSNAYPPSMTIILSNGHNFYMPTSNEKFLTSLERSHQHLKCPKISKSTKNLTRRYILWEQCRQLHILPTWSPSFQMAITFTCQLQMKRYLPL